MTKIQHGLLLILLASSPIGEAAYANESPKRFTQPIAGPQFPGPITGPNLDVVGETTASQPAATAVPAPDLAFGAFQRGYYLTALKLALPRADSGDPAAQTLIAEIYWNGLGVARDREKATDWYRFAAQGGSREAQFSYANILLRGKFVKADKDLGEKFMRQAAGAGHARAQFNVGQIITAKRPTWAGFKLAMPFYQSAAEAGIADAQYALANIFAEAKGVTFSDDKKARSWLKKSALGGFDAAQVEYGVWLANGRGGKSDVKQASFWFARAAAQGNIVAQNRLARVFAFSEKIGVDLIRAGAWHIIARRAGFSDSELDQMFHSLSQIDKKRAIEAANQLSRGLAGSKSG